jgi:hypothetical protein
VSCVPLRYDASKGYCTSVTEHCGLSGIRIVADLMSSAILVTTSTRKSRLESYLNAAEIELSSEDVNAIDAAGAKGTWSMRCTAMTRLVSERRHELVLGTFCLLCFMMLGAGILPRF